MSPKSESNSSTLTELSSELAAAVEVAGNSVVALHARKRIPSSGIIWRDGVIVSASHTVKRDDEIPVTLPNGDSTVATIAGRDSATDLIALRIKGAKSNVAPKGDSASLRVGSLVLAVGRPGRNVSASFGIISAVGEGWRTWQGARIDRVLRLDLSVYDGFSGGPLVDASGAVLGLNNSALARGTPMALPAKAVDRGISYYGGMSGQAQHAPASRLHPRSSPIRPIPAPMQTSDCELSSHSLRFACRQNQRITPAR